MADDVGLGMMRPFPWQAKRNSHSTEGDDLGVPAWVFPQWLRCTGCDLLGRLGQFGYHNTHPYRPDLAVFEHMRCTGRAGDRSRKAARRTAVPARYPLACVDGHLDEFPYDLWVHRGQQCAEAEFPALKMTDRTAGKGASAVISCASCGLRRPMNEAQGEVGQTKLPRCRGRHPHLDAFEECENTTTLILVGASNLWFAATQSIVVMPALSAEEERNDLADRLRLKLGDDLATYCDNLVVLRALAKAAAVDITGLSDAALTDVVATAMQPAESEEEQDRRLREWNPVDLLVPEWNYLQLDPLGPRHEDPASGLTVSARQRARDLPKDVSRVLAVERLRKVNALVGFTRIDALDRAGDLPRRLAPLTRTRYPTWTVATEDRGEGIFLQLEEAAVAAWEQRVAGSPLWAAHREAHRRNFTRRFSETAEKVDPDTRLPAPRYWLVHTLAHVLIRELAMTCGYSAASLSERLYGAVLRTTTFDGGPVRNHAKFLAIDHRFLLVTSANFSCSAEHGNVELGVLIDDANLAEAVEAEMQRAEDVLYERVSCARD